MKAITHCFDSVDVILNVLACFVLAAEAGTSGQECFNSLKNEWVQRLAGRQADLILAVDINTVKIMVITIPSQLLIASLLLLQLSQSSRFRQTFSRQRKLERSKKIQIPRAKLPLFELSPEAHAGPLAVSNLKSGYFVDTDRV